MNELWLWSDVVVRTCLAVLTAWWSRSTWRGRSRLTVCPALNVTAQIHQQSHRSRMYSVDIARPACSGWTSLQSSHQMWIGSANDRISASGQQSQTWPAGWCMWWRRRAGGHDCVSVDGPSRADQSSSNALNVETCVLVVSSRYMFASPVMTQPANVDVRSNTSQNRHKTRCWRWAPTPNHSDRWRRMWMIARRGVWSVAEVAVKWRGWESGRTTALVYVLKWAAWCTVSGQKHRKQNVKSKTTDQQKKRKKTVWMRKNGLHEHDYQCCLNMSPFFFCGLPHILGLLMFDPCCWISKDTTA